MDAAANIVQASDRTCLPDDNLRFMLERFATQSGIVAMVRVSPNIV
jgi:hypothetical protein